MIRKADFLVIGSGIAGLSYALKAAKFGKVIIITKKKIQKTNTALAQGGVASVFSKMDSFDLHIKDTLAAGDGLCNKDAAKMVVENGPERLKELVRQGAQFNKQSNDEFDFSLGQEGGHSAKRIVYAHDLTGKEIEDTLVKNVESNANITILEDHIAVNLITFSSSIRSGLIVTEQEKLKLFIVPLRFLPQAVPARSIFIHPTLILQPVMVLPWHTVQVQLLQILNLYSFTPLACTIQKQKIFLFQKQ